MTWIQSQANSRGLVLALLAGLSFHACSDSEGKLGDEGEAGTGGSRPGVGGSSGRGGLGGTAPVGAAGADVGAGAAGLPDDGSSEGGNGAGGMGDGGMGDGGTSTGGTSTGGMSTGGMSAGGTSTGGTSTGGTSTGGTSTGGTSTAGAAGDGGFGGEAGSAQGGADAGFGGESGGGGSGGDGGSFSCSALGPAPDDVAERACLDFDTNGDGTGWTVENGTWAIVDEAYVGNAGDESPAPTCGEAGTAMLTSTRTGPVASNVRVQARMASITTADKVLVLRGVSTRSRLELNFRASFDDAGSISGGDLVIQSLTDCVRTVHVAPGLVRIPHAATQSIDVEVELVGQSLTVDVDGARIYSGQPPLAAPLPTAAGSVGFGVLRFGGSARFDNVIIEALE